MSHKNSQSKNKTSIGKRLLSKNIVPAAVLIAVVCATVTIVHWPALSAKVLSFDDSQYFTDNVLVQNPGWTSAKRFLTEVLKPSTVRGYYQPLAMISLMFDYALGGRENNLLPFHRTSLILHVANTALIIVLLYLLFGQIWVAVGVGLLFGVHPMTVEPIPWVGERKTLLAAFFSLWSLVLYVYPRVTGHKSRVTGFYIGSLIAYLLALMSKPTSTPLPAAMLLIDYWPLRRLDRRAVFEKIPFFSLGAVSGVITYLSQSLAGSVISPGKFGPWRIPLILCHNIIFYLYKMVWPVKLSSHYPFPEPLNLSQPMVLAGVVGTCILIALLVLSFRWTRAALTGWLIFFVMIFPTMQSLRFSDVIASDKFVYLPSAGLLMILAAFLVWLCKNRLRFVSILAAAIIILCASGEAVATRRYLVYWRDSMDLCRHMLELAPNAAPLHRMMGNRLNSQNRFEEAISHHKEALRLAPGWAMAYNSLGAAYGGLGRYEEAIQAYKDAIRLKPDYAEAYYNLGVSCSKLGRDAEAVQFYKQAIAINPDYADAYYNLGVSYGKLGRMQEEIESYKKAVGIKPNHSGAYYNLGCCYSELGRPEEAIQAYTQAIRMKPDYAEAYYNLGNTYYEVGSKKKAIELYKQAIKIKPDLADAHYNLGAAYLAVGDSNSALEEYKTLKTLDVERANKLLKLIGK